MKYLEHLLRPPKNTFQVEQVCGTEKLSVELLKARRTQETQDCPRYGCVLLTPNAIGFLQCNSSRKLLRSLVHFSWAVYWTLHCGLNSVCMTLNALVHVLILSKSENIKYFLVLRYSLFCDILRDIFFVKRVLQVPTGSSNHWKTRKSWLLRTVCCDMRHIRTFVGHESPKTEQRNNGFNESTWNSWFR